MKVMLEWIELVAMELEKKWVNLFGTCWWIDIESKGERNQGCVSASYCCVTKHLHVQWLETTIICYYSSCFCVLVMDWLVRDEFPVELSWTCPCFLGVMGTLL